MSKLIPTVYPYRIIARVFGSRKNLVYCSLTDSDARFAASLIIAHPKIERATVTDVDGKALWNVVKDVDGSIIETRTVNNPSQLSAYA
jgi:hypothetical protein